MHFENCCPPSSSPWSSDNNSAKPQEYPTGALLPANAHVDAPSPLPEPGSISQRERSLPEGCQTRQHQDAPIWSNESVIGEQNVSSYTPFPTDQIGDSVSWYHPYQMHVGHDPSMATLQNGYASNNAPNIERQNDEYEQLSPWLQNPSCSPETSSSSPMVTSDNTADWSRVPESDGGQSSDFGRRDDPGVLQSAKFDLDEWLIQADVPPHASANPNASAPQEQRPRHDRDYYTPRWVRGNNSLREGWCGFCRRWLLLKNSAYWYDKTYGHGICAASGEPFSGPVEEQQTKPSSHAVSSQPAPGKVKSKRCMVQTEGKCGQCGAWVPTAGGVVDASEYQPLKVWGAAWLRHQHKVRKLGGSWQF